MTTVATTWCEQCGGALDEGDHTPCERLAVLDPPRWCPQCRRRMVVQVLPTGWRATCVEHGTRTA